MRSLTATTAVLILAFAAAVLPGCATGGSAPARSDGTATSGTAGNANDTGGELGMDRRSTAGQNSGGMGPGGMGGTGPGGTR